MTNVAILRELVFISSEKKLLIEFDNLIQFLTKNRKDGDSDVKKFNIKRQLKTKNALIEDNGCLFIPFESLIRFISDNYENYKVCRTTFDEIIEKLLIPNKANSDKSTFTLYEEISKSNFLKNFEPCLLQIDIKENDLYTLKTNQKHEFSEVEWMKICLF
ncbi:unnamed protein product [Mytilus coruscus]|uniref:Uncharacterized protein n=1 Tax=Mytilus coruscus TaxID=42192 RepID=A0A6J8EIP1_MYTCO|nr:unnamed protein product [Mytilus coruscus]